MKLFKKLLSFGLAVLMACGALSVTGFASSPFSDVSESRWSYKYIVSLYEDGIIGGKGSGKFAPADNITRAEFVKILGGIEGINADSYYTDKFTDVSWKAWYAGYVAWAVNAGVTNGTGVNTFSPDAKITRQDMAVMIYRYATAEGITLIEVNEAKTFADDSKIASYAKDAVSAMQKAGIIGGTLVGDSYYFKPTSNATREEACKMLSVLYSMTPKDDRGAAYDALKSWLAANAKSDSVLYGDYYDCYVEEVENGTSSNGNPYKAYFETFYDHKYDEICISIVYVEDMGDYDIIIASSRSIAKAYGKAFFSTIVRTTAEAGYLFYGQNYDMSYLYSISGYKPTFDPENTDGSDVYMSNLSAVQDLTVEFAVFAAEYAEELIFDKYIKDYSINDLGFGI